MDRCIKMEHCRWFGGPQLGRAVAPASISSRREEPRRLMPADREFGFDTRADPRRPARRPRRPARARCRSTRRRRTSSRTREHAADLFDLQPLRQHLHAHRRTRRPRRSRSAWPRWRAASARWPPASGPGARSASPSLTLPAPGDEIVSVAHLYGGTYNQLAITFPQLRHHDARSSTRRPRRRPRRRSADSTKAAVRRDDRQPAHRRARHRRLVRRSRTTHGRAAVRRQHASRRHTCCLSVRARRQHRRPLGHQVHRRPRHSDRQAHHRRRRQVDYRGQRSLGRGTQPDPSYHGLVFSQTPEPLRPAQYILPAHVRLCSATDLGPGQSHRSTPSSSCRGSRRCRCGWNGIRRTRSR